MNRLSQLLNQIERRRERLANVLPDTFHRAHLRFWDWLETKPLVGSWVSMRDAELDNASGVEQLAQGIANASTDEWDGSLPESDERMLNLAWALVGLLRQDSDAEHWDESQAASRFVTLRNVDGSQRERGLIFQQGFLTLFVDPLLENLQQTLDAHSLVSHYIRQYQERSETFDRQTLFCRWKTGHEGQTSEDAVARHFYKYLFDRGVSISVEQRTAHGEPDLVATSDNDDFVIEAKIYTGEETETTIAKWFAQTHSYRRAQNATRGFLLIFSTAEDRELEIDASETHLELPTITFQNHPYSFAIVDVYPDYPSASNRSQLTSDPVPTESLIEEIDEQVDELESSPN